MIVVDPEIRVFKLKPNFDFFMIGCDGIFERLDNKQCVEAIWERINEQTHQQTIDSLSLHHGKKVGRAKGAANYDEHIAAAEGVEIVLREAAASRSLDNITVLILGLKNMK